MKFKAHLYNFYKVLTRAECGGAIYLGTTREAYNIFYGLILLLRIFLLTSNILFLKRENTEPILIIKIIEWRKFIDYFGLSIEANPSRVGKRTYMLSLLGRHQALNMDISIYQGTIWKDI